jgi:hypothetical protein
LGSRAVRDEPPFAHPAVRHAILELIALSVVRDFETGGILI